MTSVQTKIPDQPIGVPRQIHTYAEFRQQIHHDLRTQHPEWVEPNGESSMRLMELLDALARRASNESIAAPHSRTGNWNVRLWNYLVKEKSNRRTL